MVTVTTTRKPRGKATTTTPEAPTPDQGAEATPGQAVEPAPQAEATQAQGMTLVTQVMAQAEAQCKARAIKAVGYQDIKVLATVTLLMLAQEGDTPSVTLKAVHDACAVRGRVLENTLWRLSDQGEKYSPPFLVRDNGQRPVQFTPYQAQA